MFISRLPSCWQMTPAVQQFAISAGKCIVPQPSCKNHGFGCYVVHKKQRVAFQPQRGGVCRHVGFRISGYCCKPPKAHQALQTPCQSLGYLTEVQQQQAKAERLSIGLAVCWLYSCVLSQAEQGYQRIPTQGKHFGSGLAGSCQRCLFHRIPWAIPVLAPHAGRSPSVARAFLCKFGTSCVAAGLSGKHARARPRC